MTKICELKVNPKNTEEMYSWVNNFKQKHFSSSLIDKNVKKEYLNIIHLVKIGTYIYVYSHEFNDETTNSGQIY